MKPVRSLEENHGAFLGGQPCQPAAPLPCLAGQEALETEPVAGQTGDRQRRQHRRRPGNRGDRQITFDTGRYEAVPGVADRRHACVGDQHHVLPVGHCPGQFGGAGGLVALEVGQHPGGGGHVDAAQQGGQAAGVLGGYHVGGRQGLPQRRAGVGVGTDGGGSQHQSSSCGVHTGQPKGFASARAAATAAAIRCRSPPLDCPRGEDYRGA